MLLNYRSDDNIEKGDSGELLQVYLLNKEDDDKIWKDKPFEAEVGPMRDKDAEDISKGKRWTLRLTNKVKGSNSNRSSWSLFLFHLSF